MTRLTIARCGAVTSLGFLVASAIANYVFGANLGRTSLESVLYGLVGVLAVAMNAIAPFLLQWSMRSRNRGSAAASALLWTLCLLYSVSSAIGFAAQNRESTVISRSVAADAYADVRRELLDLETRHQRAHPSKRRDLEVRIDEVRRRLDTTRSANREPADAQSTLISRLVFGVLSEQHVRIALSCLFALMIEACATLGLFASLSHLASDQTRAANRWQRTSLKK